jgi:Phytanoyl-CoA dioxygenase (PhyH)
MAERIKANLTPRYNFEHWRERGWAGNEGMRLQDAHRFDEDVARIATNQTIIDLLSQIYGRRAFPFQTLNFPVSTQQATHSDSTHFSSIPERFMCGVWVAMEDTDDDNGALEYFPGSHKLPIYGNEHLAVCSVEQENPRGHYHMYEGLWAALTEVHGLKTEKFYAKRGDALIWAANLYHGGGKQRDINRTRWSQVTHYYFENCAYYTPLLSDVAYGHVRYRRLTDLRTKQPIANMYAGRRIDHQVLDRSQPRSSGDFDPAAYLKANPDVAAARVDPWQHYVEFGRAEGRKLHV